ncbi:MAG TPA: helix-turn-helix domain-containing protein [Marmoricola sp.]|nr:helix-turn-helix domain-containing protein [Marmoricola sp.]
MTPERPTPITDATVLRAIAHPVRTQVLGELYAAGHARAADIADALGIPANQASFHLRQLAKYGVIEPAPELARDGRDRVWRPVHEHGLNLELKQMEQAPGGRAAVAVWRRQAAQSAQEAVARAYALPREKDTQVTIMENWVRLTKAEAEELSHELSALEEKWLKRTQAEPRDGRRTYHVLQVLQPAQPAGAEPDDPG